MNWNKLLSTKRMRQTTRQSGLDKRNEFESDYGRIIFSPALRRMHDKTQVFPLISDDNIHTRLTHSLEVQSICNSIGVNLCLNDKFNKYFEESKDELIRIIPVILSSISICHDIGNPPFGHFGEKVIRDFFKEYFNDHDNILNDKQEKDFIKFDGNAQGFRVLTRLQPLQDEFGLNLTFGTLSAYLKYPNMATEINENLDDYKNKIGVFQSEKIILEQIRNETELERIRNPFAFLMEAADSINYLVMDIEDGFNKNYYSFEQILDYMECKGNENVKISISNFQKFLDKRLDKTLLNVKRTQIVSFRIFYIQVLVNEAINTFLNNIGPIFKGDFKKELIYIDKYGIADVLDSFKKKYIFTQREIQSLELTGENVLKGLLKHFVDDFINYREKDSRSAHRSEKLKSIISNSVRSAIYFETKIDNLFEIKDYYKLRMIVDYVSGMTDQFALKLYQKLQGIRIV